MKATFKKALVIGGAIAGSVLTASAQITNTAAGVGTAITGGISPVYDAAVAVGIGAVAVGFAIMYVRKGLATRH